MIQGMKTLSAAGLCLFITACQTPPPPPAVMTERTELIVLRHTTYSDAAWIDEEEGTYIGAAQAVSPFGIVLAYNAPGSQRQLLYTVYFDTDSARLRPREKHSLARLLPYWQSGGVTLSGYADPRGTTAYNDRLAKRRAANVAAYLEGLGVTVNRRCTFGERRLPDGDLCAWRTR